MLLRRVARIPRSTNECRCLVALRHLSSSEPSRTSSSAPDGVTAHGSAIMDPAAKGPTAGSTIGTSSSSLGVPVDIRSSEDIAAAESLNQQKQVDPFRIGYNMGMQTVHLETLRLKLDDNLELLKSHFHSLREALRTNHENLRAMQVEYNAQTRAQLVNEMENQKTLFDQIGNRLQTNEDTVRELSKQQFDSLRKHIDDRLENIKDTVKLFSFLVLGINLWVLFLVNQVAHRGAAAGGGVGVGGGGGGAAAHGSGAAQSSPVAGTSGHAAVASAGGGGTNGCAGGNAGPHAASGGGGGGISMFGLKSSK